MQNTTISRYHADLQYNVLVNDILERGEVKTSRGGTMPGTIELFGPQMTFDLRQGFPLLTTKKVLFNSVFHEMMWFLRGETNIKTLQAKIWDKWADENGDLGPIYGHQMRNWTTYELAKPPGEAHENHIINKITHDQIKTLLNQLTETPDSRRLIVNLWNVGDLHAMKLPPCHCFFQCSVSGCGQFLDLKMYQRSADVAVGVPFNMAQYALLAMMLAKATGRTARWFTHTFGSAHIYEDHIEAIKKQIQNEPRVQPQLVLKQDFWDLVHGDSTDGFELVGYEPHPKIEYSVHE